MRRRSKQLSTPAFQTIAAVEKMLAPYSEKVRALSVVIGHLDGALKKQGVGAGTLGNFVTDGSARAGKSKTRQTGHARDHERRRTAQERDLAR